MRYVKMEERFNHRYIDLRIRKLESLDASMDAWIFYYSLRIPIFSLYKKILTAQHNRKSPITSALGPKLNYNASDSPMHCNVARCCNEICMHTNTCIRSARISRIKLLTSEDNSSKSPEKVKKETGNSNCCARRLADGERNS